MPSKTSIVLSTYNEANYIENTISELEKKVGILRQHLLEV